MLDRDARHTLGDLLRVLFGSGSVATVNIPGITNEELERRQRVYTNVVAKYYGDPDFKARVDADPAGTRAEGMDIPPGVTVKLLFNTDKMMHVVLPKT